MKLTILSPEKTLLCEEVSYVELPGTIGRFVVLKGHAPVISSLGSGVVRYEVGGERKEIPVRGGFAEVRADNIKVCAD